MRRNFKPQPIIYRQNTFVGGIFLDVPPAKEDEGKRRSRRTVAHIHLSTYRESVRHTHALAYVSIRQHPSAYAGGAGVQSRMYTLVVGTHTLLV